MSVISAEQAEQMNRLVRKRIDSRLFLTCNYAPTEVPSSSNSAKFYLGIQDLYKFAVDTSCIIAYLSKYTPSDTEEEFISSFRSQVNDIKDLRAVIDHSQSNADGFFAREHLCRYDSIIRAALNKPRDTSKDKTGVGNKGKIKLQPEDDEDFELLYADLEGRAARLLEDLESFIDRVATSSEKEDIVARWIQDVLDWYSRKQNIYLGQLGDVYQAKMAQEQGTTNTSMSIIYDKSVSRLHGFQMRRKLNRWIENALFADLDKQIASCDLIMHNFTDPKCMKKVRDKREACLQARQERENLIGENYRDYFFKNLRQQLEDTMAKYSSGLLPQELLQDDIKRRFEDVGSQDFR